MNSNTSAYGMYIGVVEDNNDTTQSNRLKVRVPDVYGDTTVGIPTAQLPWAYPASTIMVTPAPAVGALVMVSFKHGEPEYPVYHGVFTPKIVNKCQYCKHMFRAKCCKAFPSGIPNDIYHGDAEHTHVLPNQNGRYVFFRK